MQNVYFTQLSFRTSNFEDELARRASDLETFVCALKVVGPLHQEDSINAYHGRGVVSERWPHALVVVEALHHSRSHRWHSTKYTHLLLKT